MKRNQLILSVLFASIAFSSCKKSDLEPINTLTTDRVFSPTGLTALVVNKINLQLTWKAVSGAQSYTVEIYDNVAFTGTPAKRIEGIVATQLPYTVTGLLGDTQYGVRVMAVGAEMADSKWISTTVKTDAEQLFNVVSPADITGTTAVLRWPAGTTATAISLSPGNITYNLTATDIANGNAKITGLTPETSYTAVLKNNTSTRGTITFTATNTRVVNNLAELNVALAGVQGGEVFALAPGTYDFAGTQIVVPKSVSFVALNAAQKPVITNTSFSVGVDASLKLKNIIVDGGDLTATTTANYLVNYTASGNYGDFEADGCIIRNFKAGIVANTSGSSATVPAIISSIKFNNNLLYNFGTAGDYIDFRAVGYPLKFDFTNNTVYGMGQRDFVRMDAITIPAGSKVLINISTNTLYNISDIVSRRVFYVRLATASHEITFTKNLIANSAALLANQAATNLVNVSGNNYFNAPNMTAGTGSNVKNDTNGTALDPGFTNAAGANFTISNATLKVNGVGDPRWRQ